MTRRNPLDGLVPALAASSSRDPGVRVSDAVVTGLSPLTVRQVGAADDTTPLTPLPLVSTGDLEVGARVLLLHRGTQKILLGRTRGGASDHSTWSELTPLSSWSHYSAFGRLQIRRTGDRVEIEGAVRGGLGGSNDPIAKVPAWARPSVTRSLVANGSGSFADVRVNTSGDLYLNATFPVPGWVLIPLAAYSI